MPQGRHLGDDVHPDTADASDSQSIKGRASGLFEYRHLLKPRRTAWLDTNLVFGPRARSPNFYPMSKTSFPVTLSATNMPEVVFQGKAHASLHEAPNQPSRTLLRVLAAISFCHLLNDMVQSLLPSIYPILKSQFHLDFAHLGL